MPYEFACLYFLVINFVACGAKSYHINVGFVNVIFTLIRDKYLGLMPVGITNKFYFYILLIPSYRSLTPRPLVILIKFLK